MLVEEKLHRGPMDLRSHLKSSVYLPEIKAVKKMSKTRVFQQFFCPIYRIQRKEVRIPALIITTTTKLKNNLARASIGLFNSTAQ